MGVLLKNFERWGDIVEYDAATHTLKPTAGVDGNDARLAGDFFRSHSGLLVLLRKDGDFILGNGIVTIPLDAAATIEWRRALPTSACIVRRKDCRLSFEYEGTDFKALVRLDPTFDSMDAEATDFGLWLTRIVERFK